MAIIPVSKLRLVIDDIDYSSHVFFGPLITFHRERLAEDLPVSQKSNISARIHFVTLQDRFMLSELGIRY